MITQVDRRHRAEPDDRASMMPMSSRPIDEAEVN
jgi:hypothetical protein